MPPIGWRDWRYKFIRAGVNRGLNAAQTGRELRRAGVRIRKETLQATYRDITGKLKKAEPFKYIGKHRRPSKASFISSRDIMRNDYVYDVGFTAYNTKTGEWVDEVHYHGTNRIQTIGYVEERTKGFLEALYFENVEVKVERGWKNPHI